MSSWTELLTHAEPQDHVVQLYGEDDQLLTKNVSRYLREGLRRLDGMVVIATPDHAEAIARHLAEEGYGAVLEAERDGRLLFLDARTVLDRILENDLPSRPAFDREVGEVLRDVRTRAPTGRVRAFGEMVSLLWSEERYEAAGLLEDYWNGLLAGSGYSLFCAYRINLFGEQMDMAGLHSIVGAHTHLFAGHGTMLRSRRVGA